MGQLLRRRPSAAMVVAIVALIVAMSGTAVAASSLVNGDTMIKKNSLSGNRLRNGSVTGSKIKVSTLGTVPNASHASTADSATNATNAANATAAASAPISKVTYVTTPVSVGPSDGNTGLTATASCPSGTTVIGGGASIADTEGGFVDDSYPQGTTAWAANLADGTRPTTGVVTAICAPAASTAP